MRFWSLRAVTPRSRCVFRRDTADASFDGTRSSRSYNECLLFRRLGALTANPIVLLRSWYQSALNIIRSAIIFLVFVVMFARPRGRIIDQISSAGTPDLMSPVIQSFWPSSTLASSVKTPIELTSRIRHPKCRDVRLRIWTPRRASSCCARLTERRLGNSQRIFRSWKARYPSNRLAVPYFPKRMRTIPTSRQAAPAKRSGVAACCGIPSAKLRFACGAQ
jgi:hypothetical protein